MSTPTTDPLLVGRGEHIVAQSFEILRAQLEPALLSRSARLAFMTEEHHRVRDFVVVELPKLGRAIPPEHIAMRTAIPLERLRAILEELESNRFFLVRGKDGQVSWAFPVTSESTPHSVELSTGETVHAA
jgi:hypothetical protein